VPHSQFESTEAFLLQQLVVGLYLKLFADGWGLFGFDSSQHGVAVCELVERVLKSERSALAPTSPFLMRK